MSSRLVRTAAAEGVRHLVRQPLRSALSALTCAVAIAVTVNVISLVYGLDADLRRDVARFGRTTVDVGRFPTLLPSAKREALGPEELATVRRLLEGLGAVVAPRRQAAGRAVAEGGEALLPVIAVPPEYLATLALRPAAGRWLTAADDPWSTCVLDASTAASLFPGRRPQDVVGRTLQLTDPSGEHDRRVVGVLEDPLTHRELFESFDEGRGTRTLTSSLLSFRSVYVPEGALPGEEWSGFSIALPDEAAVTEAAERLRTAWPAPRNDPHRPTATVGVFVRREWMDALGATSSTGAFLGNIVWLIVVGVAGIMISTLHLIVVRERYDEIAVRRCEGARRRDIALQVTAEGILVALAGGIAGLPLGYAGAALLRGLVDFPFRFEAPYAAAATGIAALLGLVASVLPARRAAALQPAAVLSRRLT